MKRFERYAERLLYIWVTILSVMYSLLAVIRHNNFQSGAFDLGIFDQAIWQYAHFLFPYNTIKERFILGDHLTLTLPLFAPLFWIWDDVRILLITQAVWIAASSIAIYKIAVLRKFSPVVALCISFAYSIFYGIQYGASFDWHPVIFGVGLLAWLAYFFEAKRKKLFWITLILMLLTQENMGLGLASLGFIYLFQKQYRKQAIYFIVGGIAVSLLAAFVVSKLSPVGYEYAPKLDLTPTHIITQYFDDHDKQTVWLYSFGSYAFLPLLSPGSILATFFDLSQYFVISQTDTMFSPFNHLHAILGVFLALGVMDALYFLKKRRINPLYISIIMVLIALVLQYAFHLPLNKLTKKDYWQRASWMQDNDTLFAFIPKNASLATTQDIVPHLSHRNKIYLIWPREKTGKEAQNLCHTNDCWWLDFAGKPEYMVINTDQTQWVTQLLDTPEHFDAAVVSMEKAKKITLIKNINDARMYKINYK